MIKNLGKFKQWTGEKFGGAKVTLQTEDFQRLEQETEHRREGYESILEAVNIIQSYLLKRKTSPEDNRNKVMPFEVLGSCLYHYGTVFPDDSALGIALINLGQTETRIAALQEMLAQNIKKGYMITLENGLHIYKEYDTLRKKLTSRRLDYDSKLNRLNKAKKEKPELEQEMQAARIKYEETEHDLIQKMAYIQEFENEHRDALFRLVEAQCDYHHQAKELFESVKSNWGQGSTSDPREMMGNVMARTLSLGSYSPPSVSNENLSRQYANSSIMQRTPESSTDDYHINNNESVQRHSRIQQHTPIPLNDYDPSNHEYEKYRKAIYDFDGQNDDELSIKVGDVIAVVTEVDQGWWMGRLRSQEGIFPVVYTEEYDPQLHPLPPLPPTSKLILDQKAHAEQGHESSPEFRNAQVNSDTSTVDANAATCRTPGSPSVSSSPNLPLSTSSSSGDFRLKSTAIRPPPPPPSFPTNSLASSTTTSPKIQPITHETKLTEEPLSYLNKNTGSSLHSRTSSSLSNAPHSILNESMDINRSSSPLPSTCDTELLSAVHLQCTECECTDFFANVFKKGYCNNCFHKH